MTRRSILTGSVALMILMGALFLAAPANAAAVPCADLQPGTQAWAQCMVLQEDKEAAPIVPPSQREQTPAPVSNESSTEIWQLGLAGLVGAAVAIGGTYGVVRMGNRQRATAH